MKRNGTAYPPGVSTGVAAAGAAMPAGGGFGVLAGFPGFRTTDLDEARGYLSRRFRDHELAAWGASRRFDVRQNTVVLPDLALHYLDYGGAARIRADPLGSFYLLLLPITGALRLSQPIGRAEIEGTPRTALIISPTSPFELIWRADCTALIARIEQRIVEAKYQAYSGRPPRGTLVFAPQPATDAGCGLMICEAMQRAAQALDQCPAMLENRLMCADISGYLTGMLVGGHAHNCGEAALSPVPWSGPARLREAARFIEVHADEGLTLGMVATGTGLSGRSLQALFQKHYEMTPMTYLRQVRLTRVRAELLVSRDCRDVSVTDIAFRWGFNHMGRFSSQYQRAFGELPSQTLKRGRG